MFVRDVAAPSVTQKVPLDFPSVLCVLLIFFRMLFFSLKPMASLERAKIFVKTNCGHVENRWVLFSLLDKIVLFHCGSSP